MFSWLVVGYERRWTRKVMARILSSPRKKREKSYSTSHREEVILIFSSKERHERRNSRHSKMDNNTRIISLYSTAFPSLEWNFFTVSIKFRLTVWMKKRIKFYSGFFFLLFMCIRALRELVVEIQFAGAGENFFSPNIF